MAHYAEFGYYRDEYEGGIEKEADFKKCRRIAESYIDQYTLNRITDPETVPGLKDCTCEMTVRMTGRLRSPKRQTGILSPT